MSEIYELGVTELAAAIKDGRLTPTEIAETLLARIEQYDDQVKAFSHLDREAVLAEAKVLTEEAAAGKLRGPLHGVPFAVKEQFVVEGVPTLGDFTDPSPEVSAYTAAIVSRLKDAGGLLVGKLFMVGPAGTPPTRNPWNLGATPGGSSSGSGAAVGGRFVPFALSEQTAGSGLRPGAYCGVSAFKPTYGRNPRHGMFPMIYSTDHPCIIGTTIADVAAVFASSSGVSAADPSSVGEPAKLEPPLASPPKIGVLRNFFPEMIQPEMNAAIAAAAEKLRAAGAEVVDFELPEEFSIAYPIYMMLGMSEGTVINMRAAETRATKGLSTKKVVATTTQSKFNTRPSADLCGLLPATYYVQTQRVRRWLADRIDASMDGFDAVLTATAPGAAPLDPSTSGDATLLIPWSTLGNPTSSIPGGLDANGMPLGLQLISPRMTDEHLLATSVWCEDVIGRLPVPAMEW
jgi:aspartyl-tRNA(Asn)/glutamyl-tRNA(Gln) amidotransferase subunit A